MGGSRWRGGGGSSRDVNSIIHLLGIVAGRMTTALALAHATGWIVSKAGEDYASSCVK